MVGSAGSGHRGGAGRNQPVDPGGEPAGRTQGKAGSGATSDVRDRARGGGRDRGGRSSAPARPATPERLAPPERSPGPRRRDLEGRGEHAHLLIIAARPASDGPPQP